MLNGKIVNLNGNGQEKEREKHEHSGEIKYSFTIFPDNGEVTIKDVGSLDINQEPELFFYCFLITRLSIQKKLIAFQKIKVKTAEIERQHQETAVLAELLNGETRVILEHIMNKINQKKG